MSEYQPTQAEIVEVCRHAKEAALRIDGRPEDNPHRAILVGRTPRSERLCRLWFVTFADTRAWMREQQQLNAH